MISSQSKSYRRKRKIIVPPDRRPWPHEIRVAEILYSAGYYVEFIPESSIGTADILLNGIEYEIKSPKTNNTNTLEHRLKEAIRSQSCNIIIDSSRLKNMPDYKLQRWLVNRCKLQPQIKRMIFINKRGQIIDIKTLVWYNKEYRKPRTEQYVLPAGFSHVENLFLIKLPCFSHPAHV